MLSPNQLRGMLIAKGSSYAALGREIGVSRQAVRAVVKGIIVSARIRQSISDKIGIAVNILWPEADLSNSRPENSSENALRSMSDAPEFPPARKGGEGI